MMPRRIDSPVLKHQQATKHFNALTAEMDKLFSTDKESVFFGIEADINTREIRVRHKQPVPPQWSAIVGDCLYNLRCCLDHLVWQLALEKGQAPDAKTEFPIFLDRDKYLETKKDGTPTERSGLRKIMALPAPAQQIIGGAQPFAVTKGVPSMHPLWLLHELSNSDKHRATSIVGANLEEGGIMTLKRVPSGAEERHVLPKGPLPDGTLVGYAGKRLGGPRDTRIDVVCKFAQGIAFDPASPGKGLSVIDTLININKYIAQEIIKPMQPMFR